MSVNGAEAVIAKGEAVPAVEEHCPFLSLLLAFGHYDNEYPKRRSVCCGSPGVTRTNGVGVWPM